VLNLQASTIAAWWDRAATSLAKGLEILREDCGVITPGWLPYNTIVMPLSAVLAKVARPGSPELGALRQKLARWFWCAVFGQTYEQGSNGQAAKDVTELLAWCAGGDAPETVSGLRFDPRALRELLQSHLLPSEPDSPLWRNDFDEFLAWRQERLWQDIQRVTGLAHASPITEVLARAASIREHLNPSKPPSHKTARGTVPHMDPNPSLQHHLTRQPAHMRRVFRRLDLGIQALAPDIRVKTTRGRKRAGGVSYYTPELRFCTVDFLRTGRALPFSVFTGGQPWEEVKPSLSAPWGFATVRTEADLPRTLALAKASYEARKRRL
jgi:hypothetical protein